MAWRSLEGGGQAKSTAQGPCNQELGPQVVLASLWITYPGPTRSGGQGQEAALGQATVLRIRAQTPASSPE